MHLFRSIVLSALFITSLNAEEKLNYLSITEGKKVTTDWIIDKKDGQLDIVGKSSDNSEVTLQTKEDYTLEAFTQKDSQRGYDLKATRSGNTLTITGKIKQDTKTKSYDIGNTPWVQEFVFGFKDFLSSKAKEYKFEILRPEDYDMHDMIATKLDTEELTIDGKVYNAQKMKITLQGFKKRFWKAEVWYDTATLRMLRYKANQGPGTPVTETLFIEASE